MKHILIIDDDVHIGNMLEKVLSREGCRVSRAYSGTEALLARITVALRGGTRRGDRILAHGLPRVSIQIPGR